jgi:hypothetical protein
LAIAPLKISANIFFLLNVFVLLPLVIFLIYKILLNYGYDRTKIRLPIALSAIASMNFFWNNLTMYQINFVVFTLIIAGIYFLSRSKEDGAGILLCLASFIKIYPVFLLIYVFFSKMTKKAFFAIAITVVLCIVVPSAQRGFTKGLNDHLKYYEVFLKEFQEGKLKVGEKVHTFKSFSFKILAPETLNSDVDTDDYPVENTISNAFLIALLILIVFLSWFQIRKGQASMNVAMISCILIFTHLVSGITWSAHMVTTMFSYLPLFLVNPKKLSGLGMRIFHYSLIVIAFFLAIEGSDTTGKFIYHAIRVVDFFVIFPLILLGYYSWMIIRRPGETGRSAPLRSR